MEAVPLIRLAAFWPRHGFKSGHPRFTWLHSTHRGNTAPHTTHPSTRERGRRDVWEELGPGMTCGWMDQPRIQGLPVVIAVSFWIWKLFCFQLLFEIRLIRRNRPCWESMKLILNRMLESFPKWERIDGGRLPLIHLLTQIWLQIRASGRTVLFQHGFIFVHSRYTIYPPVISIPASFRLLSIKLICFGFGSLDHSIHSREVRGRQRYSSEIGQGLEFGRKPGLTDSRELRVRKSRLERTGGWESRPRGSRQSLSEAKVSEGRRRGH